MDASVPVKGLLAWPPQVGYSVAPTPLRVPKGDSRLDPFLGSRGRLADFLNASPLSGLYQANPGLTQKMDRDR